MSRPSPGRVNRRPPWPTLYPQAYADLITALRAQPLLRLFETDRNISVKGRFQVYAGEGVIDTFRIRIDLPDNYPRGLPILFETGERIPAIEDRHVNPGDRSACLYVPDEWRFRRRDNGFATFLSVPVRNYFLGQLYYETHGRFPPTGERRHYGAGLLDAYGEILDVAPKINTIHYWFRVLSAKSSKGHWPCPCGSKTIIRKCCREAVQEKRITIERSLARRMLSEIERELLRRSSTK